MPAGSWRRFVVQLVGVFLGGSVALLLLLALADPWGALPFRSPMPREPADRSQRWAYPELARAGRFDAAIIGNSTSRLLNPADLDPAVEAHFVNLAMISAYPYEQTQLLDVFLRAHPAPRALLIGLDRTWCERGVDLQRYGYGPLPDWLYRRDFGAALAHLFSMHAIETAWRSASARLGLSPHVYGPNGYQLLDVDHHPYDPALAHRLIGEHLALPWSAPPSPDAASWRYESLDWLAERAGRLPAGTRLILVFVPRHFLYPAPGSDGAAMIAECKRRVAALVAGRPNTSMFDLALPHDDSLWWDAVHLRPEPSAQLSKDLARAIRLGPAPT